MENEKPVFKKIISQIILNFKYLSFFFFPRILFRRNLIRFVAPRQETRNTVEVKCTYSQRVKGINELSTGKEKKVSLFCEVKQYLIFLELQTVPLKKSNCNNAKLRNHSHTYEFNFVEISQRIYHFCVKNCEYKYHDS